MKAVFKIGSSEELNSSQAVLLMEVGEMHCCFAILDYANQMMVQLGYYIADKKDNGEMLEKILEIHPELKQSFRQTIIGYYLPENVLIPAKFYRFEETQAMLESMYEKDRHIVVSESIAEWQMYNAYQVPATIHQFLSRWYSTGHFWHVYSTILKYGIEQQDGGNLLVDFKTDSFSVVAIKDNSLLLAQIFSYTTSGDVLYWLLKICKQFLLSRDDVKLMMSGLIDKQSAVFKELYQYFRQIEFATIDNDIQASGDFDEYPGHFFSSLYKLASCVS